MPILAPNTIEFLSRSPDQTRRVGMRMGSVIRAGDVVCLDGELGSGKTTLVQGIASGWGSLDPVSSPTFVLVNVYRRTDGERLAHLDAFRLNNSDEAEALDLETLLEAGPLVVEWAPRIRQALPLENLWVNLRWVADERRGMQFSASGEHYERLLEDLQESMFGMA